MSRREPIIRLSKPELGTEVWIGIDSSWMSVNTKCQNNIHKDWIIVCLKDNGEFVGGDVLEETYNEWYQAKPVLLNLVRKAMQ